MEALQFAIVITMLAVLAEVTYLVVKLPRQNISKKQARPILVDTSVLIDGRIIAVAKSGFIGDTLVIPRSVIGELQFLADNADHEKRSRARYGLDVVKELQSMPDVQVEILQDGSKAAEGVDERLLTLAKKHAAVICTIDYNLNKVAVVEGLRVLNVNELAQSLRMAYLPGEKMLLELVQKGQDAHQAVGYLVDGTMVVIEHASKNIGQTVEIEFIRSLQTAAGRMMFAKMVDQKPAAKPTQHGRNPIEKMEKKPAQQPQQARGPKPKPANETTSVYHSDQNDHRLVNKNQSRSDKPRSDTHSASSRRPAKKPRTSSDREASLLELVDKQ